MMYTKSGHRWEPGVGSLLDRNTVQDWVWWCTPVVPALGRQRNEKCGCEGRLGYTVRVCSREKVGRKEERKKEGRKRRERWKEGGRKKGERKTLLLR